MEEAIRILVVDDEPDIRRICRILLETGGYTVLEAATGAEAVEQVRQHPELDLILMDIMMPELGGYDACSRIRSYSTAPVLRQTVENGKLRLRQLQRLAVYQYAAVFLVEHDAGPERPPARFALIHPVAPQLRLDLHHQLRVRKRLG